MRAKLLHSTVLASASILLATTAASARTTAPATTDPAGLAQSAAAWHRADSRPDVSWRAVDLQKQLNALDRAGAVGVVGAARSERGQWAGAAGDRTLGDHAAQPGDKFRVGSITKPMVATVLMQLVQEGRISLDTRIDSVLPGLLGEHGSQVTLEHLLSHRSGLPDYLTLMALTQGRSPSADFTARAHTDKELVGLATGSKWLFAPGTRSSYSNTNYIVAGMVAQAVTGQPVSQLVRERVFRPAGMADSSFPTGTDLDNPHLNEYAGDGKTWGAFTQHASQFGAAGAVVSTPEDLNRFWRAFFTGRLVKPETVNTMIRPRGQIDGVLPYGLGVMQLPMRCGNHAELVYGHTGGTWGTYSIALGTRDGRAQASTALTGRLFTTDAMTRQARPELAALPAMQYACGD